MKTSKLLIVGVLVSALCMVVPTMAATPTFTGDVENDFPDGIAGDGYHTILDGPSSLVSSPPAPAGTVPGWDIKDLRLTYDDSSDTLYVGINVYTLAGDADDNGTDGTTAQWLLDEVE